jgi:lipoprotein-anchoring transpeptidase ErfK/SrfK
VRTRISLGISPGFVAAALMLILSSLSPAMAVAQETGQEWAPPRTVWVAETGHTVDGFFLDDWREHPQLFGLPITEESERPTLIEGLPADIRIVQYFENIAIAYVPEAESREMMVRALSLGSEALMHDRKDFKDIELPKPSTCAAGSEGNCLDFQETGFHVAGDFHAFWANHDGERLIGPAITGAFETPDGYVTQYFEYAVLRQKSGEAVEAREVGRETADFMRLSTDPVPQPERIPIYDEVLFVEPEPEEIFPQIVEQRGQGGVAIEQIGPGPQQGASKEIVVSISAQTLWAYEGGQLVIHTLVSTGTAEVPETTTPLGYYAVHLKYVSQTMRGSISNEDYEVEDVPWVMYFDHLGNAIHGTYWHNNFGTPMSHGCVNLPLDVAEFLFHWAPEGTAVSVIA